MSTPAVLHDPAVLRDCDRITDAFLRLHDRLLEMRREYEAWPDDPPGMAHKAQFWGLFLASLQANPEWVELRHAAKSWQKRRAA